MKNLFIKSIIFSTLGFNVTSAFTVLEFPSSIKSGSTQNESVTPNNTNTSFFENLLKRINFGGTQTSVQNTNNTSNFVPTTINTNNYDKAYENILKENMKGLPNTNNAKVTNPISPETFNISTTNNQNRFLTRDEMTKKFEDFILEINKRRTGYASPTQTTVAPINHQLPNNNSNSNNNVSNNQNPQLANLLRQNSMPSDGFSSCSFVNSPQEKQACFQSLKLTCQQGFIGGELLMPECAQLPQSTYGGLNYGSSPSYSLDNFVRNDPYYTRAADGINVTRQSFPENTYYNKEGNYIGPDRNITGNATHYACTKKNGQYFPDNYLITRNKYVTAFGYKARYGTNVGDSTNACNFNYCGVAVPLQFINATYGGKSAAKNQLIQIVNTENLKCTVAPIQDISAIRTFTHAGSNAVIDLSLCVMERLTNKGSIRVQYRPLKKGEVGCNQSINKN